MDLSPLVVPIPGATRVETVPSAARAGRIALSDQIATSSIDGFRTSPRAVHPRA